MIVYWIFRGFIGLFGRLPFWVLYRISDVLAFFLQYVVRYRYKVIYTNLKNAFPNKTEKEIRKIIKGNYRNISDVMVESIKGFTIKPEDLVERFKISYPPVVDEMYEDKRGGIVLGGHYANWEWGVVCGGIQLKAFIIAYYRPIKNKYINNFLREKHSGQNNLIAMPVSKVHQGFSKYKDRATGHLLIADQSPTTMPNAIWIDFLNQETACLNGVERLAKRYDYPVFFLNIQRVKRGFYTVGIEEISLTPQTTKKGEITTTFMRMLEQQIIKKPEDWLWSHKRWKKKKT